MSNVTYITYVTHHANFKQVIDQSDRSKIYREQIYFQSISFESFATFSMTGFNFDHGGRRCIRPILEKYQSGKSRLS